MGNHARKKARLKWRRRQIAQAAGCRGEVLRSLLAAVLGIEILIGSGIKIREHPDAVRLLRVEEEYHLEWIRDERLWYVIYGIRLNPEQLEIEFYRQQQEIH